MNEEHLLRIQAIAEAALLAAGKPLSLDQLRELFTEDERPARQVMEHVMMLLESACENRGFELKKVASGYRLQIREEYAPWVGRLFEERPQRYSRALLETLALIAYRQPITRGEIEDIRGVTVSSNIIRTLLEREWVRVVGHRMYQGGPLCTRRPSSSSIISISVAWISCHRYRMCGTLKKSGARLKRTCRRK